jgi:ferrous iron transport protein A
MHLTGTALDQVAIGDELVVLHVQPPTMAPEWARWLEEIGFVAGERVRLMARGFPGSDPLVVRVGQSTFALRQAEAACIRVAPSHTPETSPSNYVVALEGSRA